MDYFYLQIVSFLSYFGYQYFDKKSISLKKLFDLIKKSKIHTPSQMLQKFLEMKNTNNQLGFIEGITHSHDPLISQLDKKSLLVYSINFFRDIFSNKQQFKEFQKEYKNQIFASQISLLDSENLTECKIEKNFLADVSTALQHIKTIKHYKQLNFFESFIVGISLILEIVTQTCFKFMYKNFQSLYFSGYKIGVEQIELGIKTKQIIQVFGEIALNNLKNGIIIKNPQYFTLDKRLLLIKLSKKLSKVMTFKYIFLLIFFFINILTIRKLKIDLQNYIQKKREDGLDQLRNIKQLFNDDLMCIICVNGVRNIIFKPCKHMCICFQCLKKLQKKICPICKLEIKDFIEIFIS